MWVEENPGERINHARTREAQEAGAQIIATACPFCVQMYEDGIPAVEPDEEKRLKTFDIAELLEASVTGEIIKPASLQPGSAGKPSAPPAEEKEQEA